MTGWMLAAGALGAAWWVYRAWRAVRDDERWRTEHEQLPDPPVILITPGGEYWEWPERRNGDHPEIRSQIGGIHGD